MSFSILTTGISKKYTFPSKSWPRLPARPDIWKWNRITKWNFSQYFSYPNITKPFPLFLSKLCLCLTFN
jgi:hypothetical protein